MPIDPPEILRVEDKVVACDGGPNPALGHPRVFLTMGPDGQVVAAMAIAMRG